ncbi:MAG: metallophosphoesterase [Acidobacteria bacterium]|nr:metallophosphoesterase [Acidobacteriota bacterium]
MLAHGLAMYPYSHPLSFEIALRAVELIVVLAHLHLGLFVLRHLPAAPWSRWAAGAALLTGLLLAGPSALMEWDTRFLDWTAPVPWKLASAVWVVGLFGAYAVFLGHEFWRWMERRGGSRAASGVADGSLGLIAPVGPASRRAFVTAAVAPFVIAGYGTFAGRKQIEVEEIDIALRGLPADLDGLRLAQVSDLHCGSFLTLRDVQRVVAMVNETRPHIALVTGDLITRPNDPLTPCIEALAGLRADAGIWGCMGNHEMYSLCERFTEAYGRARGIEFLRGTSKTLRFGNAELNLAGVDYQRSKQPYLEGAQDLIKQGVLNVLLSHNPDVFPVAADLGYDLVISGHTHGGQITVEIIEQWANPGRFFTPFVTGEYRRGDSALYVSRGIGTVSLPMRIGAMPEITLLRLRRA